MNTFGYLFMLVGVILIRQVSVGRVHDIPTDAADLTTAFLNADTAGISEVMSRRGTNISSASGAGGSVASPSAPGAVSNSGSSSLLAECEKLGNAAKGYRWGATGPDYYDCSGLIWAAMRNLGMYTGARFVTQTVHNVPGLKQVSSASVGDLVVWPSTHMGICSGSDQMYSARSPSKGIGFSTISGDSSVLGTPLYYSTAGLNG